MNVKLRAAAGFAVLLALFLALVLLQLVVGDRLRSEHNQRAHRLDQLQDNNRAVLQYLTDAESGVRGFQLTGGRPFLEPYDSGRAGAFAALDYLAAATEDTTPTGQLLVAERQAAVHWLYAYAIPIVNAGVADADEARAARGKAMFDSVRTANADLDAAIRNDQDTTDAADRRAAQLAQLLFGGLAVAILITGLALAVRHQRHLLSPVEHVRQTLRRLTAGDLTARAVLAGPGEMRTLIDSLNALAAETERLLTAEQARAARGELRQAVAAELRVDRDPRVSAERVAALIGRAFGAEQVHTVLTLQRDGDVATAWPAGAPALDSAVQRQIHAAAALQVHAVPEAPGAIAMALRGDPDCPPGLLCVVRPEAAAWTPEEHRSLAAVGREIDHAVRQERMRLRQERLISELRTLDEQKDVFVATVTHELRTPLTSILGYTEMLADGDGGELSPAQRRGVTAIRRNAHRLEATVADLLLLDQANERAGARIVPVDLAASAAAVQAELAAAARGKNLRSTLDTEPAWVRGDAGDLERVLRNLMENAIKFTPAGGLVGCRVRADGEQVSVTITDTGIGIPADDLAGVFTPFHRATNAMHQAVQGSGLGLAIVRKIVAEHGGSVTASSELDGGSTFTVTLPCVVPH